MIKRNEQGILIVVSGPSGCGKSTVDNLLIKKRKNINRRRRKTDIRIRICYN